MKRVVLLAALALAFAVAFGSSGLRFSHKIHVGDGGITCDNCHPKAPESRTASDHLVGGHDACGQCHNVDESCGTCHTGTPASYPAKRDLHFAHKRHVDRGAECGACHVDVAQTEGPVGVPAMSACFACHDGVVRSARCGLCHVSEGRARATAHPPDWKRQHALYVTRPTEACGESCHTDEAFCRDCHLSDNVAQRTHPLTWSRTHGQTATRGSLDCASCHEQATFCAPCHASQMVMPWEHASNTWRSDHGEKARREIETCAACHDTADPTCVRCHADRTPGRGNDHSIHPTDFAQYKGPWHDDPGFQCFRCHSPARGFCGYCHEDEHEEEGR